MLKINGVECHDENDNFLEILGMKMSKKDIRKK